ncbi:MAG: hypothetical protein C4326_14530 [Ignavibacteria bacterium]
MHADPAAGYLQERNVETFQQLRLATLRGKNEIFVDDFLNLLIIKIVLFCYPRRKRPYLWKTTFKEVLLKE